MIQLAHGALSATIDPASGGRLTSLRIQGSELIADHEEREPDFLRGCFPLAPWCGVPPGGPQGLRDARPMHGLVHSSAWEVLASDRRHATLQTWIGPGTPRPWLGRGRLALRYELAEDALAMRLSLTAVEGSWPVALGFHPWFRRQLGNDASEARYSYSPAVRLVQEGDGWPRVPTADLGPYPHDDVFAGLAEPPHVRWSSGIGLRIESDAPIWVVYERHPHGFCIEPWTDADGPLATHRTPPLAEGDTRQLELRLAVLTRQ